MGDYHWIMAVEDHRCRMCGAGIKRAEFFYFERGRKEFFCRDCGRAIRKHGEELAGLARNVKGRGSFDDLFGGVFGGGMFG